MEETSLVICARRLFQVVSDSIFVSGSHNTTDNDRLRFMPGELRQTSRRICLQTDHRLFLQWLTLQPTIAYPSFELS